MKDDIRAVVFDLDGTLTDTEKVYLKAWPEALRHFGWECPDDIALELRSLGRPYAPQKFREWYGDSFDYPTVREYRKRLVAEALKDGIPLKPGAVEILEWLRSNGIITAIATSNDMERTVSYLERIGLSDCFDRIACADMVEFGKPAPDIYEEACRKIGTRPEETVAVEDSPNGIRSAFRAGLKAVMIPDLTEPDEELSKMLYARLDSLLDLKTLF